MYVINSAIKGVSTKTYLTYESALLTARDAWRADPAGVGMCKIQSVDHDTISAEWFRDAPRECACDCEPCSRGRRFCCGDEGC